MKIALVSDAWAPQINGVVRTLQNVVAEATRLGHEVRTVTPDLSPTIPCPTYPEIRLALRPGRAVRRIFDDFAPDAIHIATEGPLGVTARGLCLKRGLPFTTSFHTKFPEYLAARFRVPVSWSYRWLRHFHAPAKGVMVATDSVRRELDARGFGNLQRWTRGVDARLFSPERRRENDGELAGLPRPIFLAVGRVAVEKNLAAFLDLDLPGSKVVVGDGPQLGELRRRHPEVHFLGPRTGVPLAEAYASADVFVFPSRTDTFGLVLLEAMASGLPVAAYPVPGPLDVIGDSPAGRLDEDLRRAALGALDIPRTLCREHALTFDWPNCANQFLHNLHPVH